MHLLYLDESGHSHDPASEFFVLAGFSIFERQTHWLEQQIDPIALRFSPRNPRGIEFHGSPMRGGKDEWKGVPPADRVQAVKFCRGSIVPEFKGITVGFRAKLSRLGA